MSSIKQSLSHVVEAKWDDSEANFPRKQMMGRRWISLNGTWDFRFDDDLSFHLPGEIPDWNLKIQVPFAPESKASGIENRKFHPRCWYQKKFKLEKSPDKKILLHFGAVDYEAKVWLNGHLLGRHQGGYTPFCFDVTAFLKDEGEQVLIVRADDDPADLAKPRGKQDWQLEPHSIWYPRTTGIWQSVWLEEVPETYIEKIRWTPLIERWEVGCEVFIHGFRIENLRLRVCLTSGDKVLADDTYRVINQEVHRRIALSDPGIDDYRNELLWSPEKPTLIDALLEIYDGDELVDRVKSYTAIRSISIQRDRVLLNGRPYFMRLVLDQGYWPDTLMTPPNVEALQKDIELVKLAGFNGVRKHQKIEDPEFLYLADKMGLLVWTEMPSAYRFTQESVRRLTREWTEVIDRDSNHPCIAVWVPFNESWGVPDLAEKEAHQNCVQALYHLTKTLDPTRPVIGNDGWESTATDIMGIHDYDDDPERLQNKYLSGADLPEILHRRWPGGRMLTVEGYPHSGQPIILTEFGGIACFDIKNLVDRSAKVWGYSVCLNPEDFRRKYERMMKTIHSLEMFCGFCYTQFTDTFQEANGLFTMDRRPKFSLNAMVRATRGFGETRGELTSSPSPAPLPPDPELPYENSDL